MRGIAVVGCALLLMGLGFAQAKPVSLNFRSLLIATDKGLAPAKALVNAHGKRVRIEGYMSLMESPTAGGFWLTPTPVFQDESGGGTGDLPPSAIFVIVRGAGQRPVKHLAGLLSVSGMLKLSGKTPRIVITLDSTKDINLKKAKPAKKP